MSDIEKRARELLAAELGDYEARCLMDGLGGAVTTGEALSAIIAALTPPEGFVLVDAKLLRSVRVARLAILQKQAEAEQMDDPHDASMWADCAADLDAIAPRGMLAARPEVKP